MSQATVAVVAGAGGALGHATTEALAASGLRVVALDRNEHAMSDLRDVVHKEATDPADPGAVTRLIDRIAAEVGPPGVLVNAVGAFRLGEALATTPDRRSNRVPGQRGGSAGERGDPAGVRRLVAWPGAGRIRITMIRR